jgi:uncharacterized protein YoxC
MTEVAVMGVAFAVVVVVVTLCATFGSADKIAKALRALATVFASAWPWKR